MIVAVVLFAGGMFGLGFLAALIYAGRITRARRAVDRRMIADLVEALTDYQLQIVALTKATESPSFHIRRPSAGEEAEAARKRLMAQNT